MWFLDNLTITFDHDLCLRFCLIPPWPHDRQTFSYKTLNNDVCAASHRWRPHDPHQVHRGEFIRSPVLCWLQDEPSGVAGRGINLRWCNGHSGISNLSGRFYSGWDLSGFGGDKVTAVGAFQLLALCARWHWYICPGYYYYVRCGTGRDQCNRPKVRESALLSKWKCIRYDQKARCNSMQANCGK